ncbi:sensor histidine kinase [Archangium lansingense]|uniref:sensor histidine kinase n=1 Tax=Archangium lansingense TaxID=2995310 RepID=UPI003B7B50FE
MTPSTPIRFLTYPSLGDMKEHVRAELLGHAISLRMGRPVVVETVPTYEALTRELEAGRVDLAWATAEQCAQFASRAWTVLRAVRFGRGYYHAALVCRASEPLTLERLRGKRAAWVTPHSVGGYLLIARRLERLGMPPSTVFSEEHFVGTYRKAVQAVISGKADVTSIPTSQPDESAAHAYMGIVQVQLSSDERQLAPILFTEATPADGILLTHRLSREEAASLASIILELSKDGTGLERLSAPFNAEGFVSSSAEQLLATPWPEKGADFLAVTLDEEERCRRLWSAMDRTLGRDVRGGEGQLLTDVVEPPLAERLLALTRLTRQTRAGGRVEFCLDEEGREHRYAAEVTLGAPDSGQRWPEVALKVQDITEPHTLEKHLYRLASFPLLHPSPMLELGMDGSLLYANPAAHEHFPDLAVRGRSHPVVEATLSRLRAPEAALPSTVHLEGRYWELTVLALTDAEILRVFAQDVTARKQMEDRLILQDRLAALGTMTAGIAHELRNPLNFVTSFSEFSGELVQEVADELNLLESKLGSEHLTRLQKSLADLALNMRKVQEHGSRMESIIRSMLDHSRGGKGERQEHPLNAVLSDSINLAYHGMRSRFPTLDTKLEQELDESAGMVDVVPQELSRVVVNLLDNACYSVSAKRRLRGADGFQPKIRVKTRGLGESVELRIYDNGLGIPLDVRDKLFTPFFTTKPAGEGTGLGLSLSHDIIVKGHGGSLRFESEEGSFTEFIITLPRRRA